MTDKYWKLRAPAETPEDEVCSCDEKGPVLLVSRLGANPIACATCMGEVAPEHIGVDGELADDLAAWRGFHDAFFTLWLDSGEFEDWASEQLKDPASPVNQRGLRIAKRLNEHRRCYFVWFQDLEEQERDPSVLICPCCESRLAGLSGGRYAVICESCSIALLTT